MSFVQIQRKRTLNPNTSRNKKMIEHQKGPPNTLPRQAKTILMKWNKKTPSPCLEEGIVLPNCWICNEPPDQ